jgi:16S rRNA processing protein RimM
MIEYLRIGKIINTRGLKGEVKVEPLTDDIKRFESLSEVIMENDTKDTISIENVNYHKKFVYIKFKNVNSIEEANALRGMYLIINRKDAIELNKDQYFICDLIGLKVYEEKRYLGELTDVLQTGANDVYIVKNNDKEILLPAIKDVILNIDIERKKYSKSKTIGKKD